MKIKKAVAHKAAINAILNVTERRAHLMNDIINKIVARHNFWFFLKPISYSDAKMHILSKSYFGIAPFRIDGWATLGQAEDLQKMCHMVELDEEYIHLERDDVLFVEKWIFVKND